MVSTNNLRRSQHSPTIQVCDFVVAFLDAKIEELKGYSKQMINDEVVAC